MQTSLTAGSSTSADALHAQIADALRERIATGALPRGASLPSEAELCKEFQVSRGTARQAIAALRAEGLIMVSRGKPPRVVGTVPSQELSTFLSFSEWAKSSGRTPGQRTLETARRLVSPAAAAALGLDQEEAVVEVLRLRTLDEVPVMVERTTFIMEAGRHLFNFDPDSGSIFAYLSSQGVDLHAARHTFDALNADSTDAKLLEVEEGTALLRETRVTFSADGVPLEYSEDRYLPGSVTFTVENTMQNRTAVVRALPQP
ncbi:GntR family transcriptional regulator [Micrococcoides hystricis]|uniref:GntR family transcriptional regulator n=1 Tax=Micrococcoides hystricis TaxID=1572761 RepID=A0ABV6P8X2_9MICC